MSVRSPRRVSIALALAAAATGGVVLAQVDANRGVAPVDSSGSFEVSDVAVDTAGKTAEEARYAGWRLAQRKGWQMLAKRLGSPVTALSDGALDAIVSGIVVQREQIGPNRYVARLGVLFDRGRAGSILGVAAGASRSAPMLVLPVEVSGGTATVLEQRSQWQQAWARFRTANSSIDYIRPSGTGADALLLNAGQMERPGRGWWRSVLDLYGAQDMVFPTARLYRQWPGGPVIGVFEARHGPDNQVIGRFTLRVASTDGVPALLDAGVKRLDEAYSRALAGGQLEPDSGLVYVPPVLPETEEAPGEDNLDDLLATLGTATTSTVILQFDTPSAGAVASAEAAIRDVPGVSSATTSSLALGGVSLMRVTYDADPALLRTSLEQRGWVVSGSGTTLRIRRAGAPAIDLPALPPDNGIAG